MMATLQSVMNELGVNSSFFVQFVIFLLAFPFLHFLIFRPHFLALKQRQSRTEGDEVLAEKMKQEISDLEKQYQNRQRTLNQDLKEIYTKANKDIDLKKAEVVLRAHEKARKKVEQAHKTLQSSVIEARKTLPKEVSSVSDKIIEKVLH